MKFTKCDYCDADIGYLEDAEYLQCPYCGNAMERPAADDSDETRQKIENLYARGRDHQRAGRFDDAAKCYHSVLDLDHTEAEAHWKLFLCRYGIEYVRNDADGEYVPTICHLIEDNVLKDADYLAAVQRARNGEMRSYYQREAQHIHAILTRYVQIRAQETYDVFISVKQSDEQGNPTKDSLIALDIYHILTYQYGMKVFNSQISLQKHVGEEWEPYIMAALMSAKVMLVVGTNPAHMISPWVRNEWHRYRWLMANSPDGGKRVLLPCVSMMSPSELPSEMGYVQAINLNDFNGKDNLVGALQRLLGVQAAPPPPPEPPPVPIDEDKEEQPLSNKAWERILAGSDNLKDLSVGAALVPVFQELYKQDGASLEVHKDDFNAYIDRCRKQELEPVQTQLQSMQQKMTALQQECAQEDQKRKELRAKSQKFEEMQKTKRKSFSTLGMCLAAPTALYAWGLGSNLMKWALNLKGRMSLTQNGIRNYSMQELYDYDFAQFATDHHLNDYALILAILLAVFLLTRKKRAQQRSERAAKKATDSAVVKQRQAYQQQLDELEAALASKHTSIKNYTISIERAQKEEQRIQQRYPRV